MPFFFASARCCFIRRKVCRSCGVSAANFCLSRSLLSAFSSSFFLASDDDDDDNAGFEASVVVSINFSVVNCVVVSSTSSWISFGWWWCRPAFVTTSSIGFLGRGLRSRLLNLLVPRFTSPVSFNGLECRFLGFSEGNFGLAACGLRLGWIVSSCAFCCNCSRLLYMLYGR